MRIVFALFVLAAAPAAAQIGTPAVPTGIPAVDSLLERGRLQEAAWRARALGDTAAGEGILARLEAILTAPPLSARPQDMDDQGVSYTYRLDHGGGIQSVFKVNGSDIFCPSCGTEREVAAYRIDRLLGFDMTPMTVPVTVVADRDTLEGSAMYFVHGATGSEDAGIEKPDALRLFDAIIGNSDRHNGNWIIAPDGRVVAIDHNRAFEYQPSTRPKTCWETEVDAIEQPADLGTAYDRYRSLPADSIRAAIIGVLPQGFTGRFLDMRPRIVERITQRVRRPDRYPPLDDCDFGR